MLEDVRTALSKKFGEEILFSLNDAIRRAQNTYPTGLMSLDYALGVGGLPPGRIVEIFGDFGTGKTTVALRIIASCQHFFKEYFKDKEVGCAFIDVEHALDPPWAMTNGVNFDELLISQPDSAEQALDVVEALVLTDKIKLIVVDSVAALTPMAELEGEMSDNTIALQARLMSKALRKLKGIASNYECALVFINQVREQIGGYIRSETTPGGRALRFYASIRIEVRKGEPIKKGKDQVGHQVNVRVIKNKVAPPYKQAQFDIRYDIGADAIKDIFNIAKTVGIIQGKGAWFTYGSEFKWQGETNAVDAIREDDALRQRLSEDITAVLRSGESVAQTN